MFIIEYFLPYNNFIIIFTLIILNIFLVYKRSYWYTILIGNLLLLALLVIIGFNPVDTFFDIMDIIVGFLSGILDKFWDIITNIFNKIGDFIVGIFERIADWILPWR